MDALGISFRSASVRCARDGTLSVRGRAVTAMIMDIEVAAITVAAGRSSPGVAGGDALIVGT